MNTQDTLANHGTDLEGLEGLEVFELGSVSEETRGTTLGHTWDGMGRKWP
jgi:hypothetical protein